MYTYFLVQPTKHNSFTSVASEQVPVRLTPAWEENNLPNDELNFKTFNMDDAVLETDPPKDRQVEIYMNLLLI
jgi:equilibrative nucleoside transporter 1/2/3